MRNSYEASSLELLESEEYDKYRKNGFSENTYTKTNSVPKTTALPSYEIPQKKVYTYSPPIPKVEKVETNVSKTPDVSSVELLESGNYSQKEIFGGEQKKNNTASKTYAESQVKSSPEISSLEYTEDYLPKQVKLPFESLIDIEKDEHIKKRLLPVLQTFDAAKYSRDFATKLEARYQTDEAYRKWIDESEDILEDYARNHPEIDFSAAIDRIRHINGTWTLHELLKMGEEEKLTKDGESSKVEEKSKKDKILDTASNVLVAASLIPGLDTFTNLASIPVDLLKGDYKSAVLDALGMIPVLGEGADALKLLGKADMLSDAIKLAGTTAGLTKFADKSADALKIADKATDAVKATDKAADVAKTTDKAFDYSNFPKNIHEGRQGKHIVGHNNYTEGRSIFSGSTSDARQLIERYGGTGAGVTSNVERVDFKKTIGKYVDIKTGEAYDTTVGTIKYSKDGAHIVPAKPNWWR